MCDSRSETVSETDDSTDYRQTTQLDQDVAAPAPVPALAQPEYDESVVAAQPAYGSRITQRLPEGTHSGFIKQKK